MPSASSPFPAAPRAPAPPPASIVVPTRARPDYLRVALASIAPQASAAGAEVVVVDDAGASEQARRLANRFGARYEAHPRASSGLNVARNTGVARTEGELVVFVDDDVEIGEGWLAALLRAAHEHPQVDVFTGPIRPRLEGTPPRSCGREQAPITSLELGPDDTWTRFAWGANMTIRRAALDRLGPFDVSLEHGGDEQEWQERLAHETPSAGVLYVAAAAHGPSPSAGGRACVLSAGQPTRAGARPGAALTHLARPSALATGHELRTLMGCAGHVVRAVAARPG